MIWIAIIIVLVYFIIKYAVRNGIIEAHNYIKGKDQKGKDDKGKDEKENTENEKDKYEGRHW